MTLPSGFELLRLAPELVSNVIRQLGDKTDLSRVRLSCKSLNEHAAKELFKDAYISPSKEHVSSWNAISQDNVIRRMPRHAIIHTQPDTEDHGLGHTRERIEVDKNNEDAPDFNDALASLSMFPNLGSLEIAFTPECMGREADYWQEVAENVSKREEMLTLVFQAIKDRAADERNRAIRRLTIINLQNCPIPEFTSSDLFRNVMGQLEELHITMTQEYNEHGPDNDYTRVELQTFPAYFCSHWLKPISANLKALSVYSKSANWGPFPGYFDPSDVSFPKLETLALGYYTLAHDDDLNWVLAIKSLRKLILHNCMIASWICIVSENMAEWKVRTHDWTRLSDPDEDSWAEDFTYGGNWSRYFDRIAEHLPDLVDFRFRYGNLYGDPPYGITHRDSCPVEIFHQRYICFDNEILPTHWSESSNYDKGNLHSWLDEGFPINMHKETLDADQKSLDALLRTLRSRRWAEQRDAS